MNGLDSGNRSILGRTNSDGFRSHRHYLKNVARILSALSVVFTSATTFWWFGSANAFAAGGPPSAASLSQCTNGAVGPPIAAEPCVGSNAAGVSVAIPGINGGASTSYKNWVNGNSNGTKSHWSEGDFIPYRATVSGLQSGTTHTLVFHFDTVNTGLHAIDYLGSYDATEASGTATTSVNGTIVNANNNNPCSDLVAAGTFAGEENCTPAAPQSSMPFPAAQLVACDGAPGAFTGTQEPGAMSLFGPSGSAITGISYVSQNVVSGQGTCTTTVQVSFTVPHTIGGSKSIVLAWGGHIASEREWGAGNGASSVSGSPYHMSLDTLDGASTGSQDRALAASAIYYTPFLATVVMDDGSPVTGTVVVGSSVNDTAALTGALSTASGTVNYLLYANSTCTGESPISNNQVTVTDGTVPPSPSFVADAGSYSYYAQYSGDGKDLSAVSPCEPFTVGDESPTVATVVYNSATNQPLASPVPLDAMVYDTATITHSKTVEPTGTVTYTFYSGGTCLTGTVVGTPQVVNVNPDGTVPNSSVQGPITSTGGPYAYKATYSGDSNYLQGSSDCEPIAVGQTAPSISTTVVNAGTGQPLVGPLPDGGTVYDTTAIVHNGGPEPTGTVTYTFYSGGGCVPSELLPRITTVVGTPQTVTVNADGTVPNSSETAALTEAGGPYAYQVSYSGDSNYPAGSSDCEPFSVGQILTSLQTTIYNAATNQAVASALPLGSSVYDTAVLGNVGDVAPSGTVTYTFYSGGSDCESGTVVGTYNVAVSQNGVPNSPTQGPLTDTAGPYAFKAYYSGDENHSDSFSPCEPLTVTGVTGESVLQGVPSVSTTVYDASNNLPVGDLSAGATVYDTLAFSNLGNIDPTGSVTYTFFSGGDCVTGTVVGTPQVVAIGAHGTVPFSATQGPLTVAGGPYAFQASYSGDLNYLGDTSDCEPFVVGPSGLTATTALSATTTIIGAPVYDTAVLHGATSDAGGKLTYSVYSDSACTAFLQDIGTVTVTSGQVPNSAEVSFSSPGSYYFQVYYTGDGNNPPVRSICGTEVLSVTQVPIGGAQTGAAARGGNTTGRLLIILLFGGGIVTLGAGVLVRRRWPLFGTRER